MLSEKHLNLSLSSSSSTRVIVAIINGVSTREMIIYISQVLFSKDEIRFFTM